MTSQLGIDITKDTFNAYHSATILQFNLIESLVDELEDLLLTVDQRIDDGVGKVEAVINRQYVIVTEINLHTSMCILVN